MIIHSFINKSNTITRGSEYNYGLHPIAMLTYGGRLSRILLSFSMERILTAYMDKTIPEGAEVKHVLKMTNCAAINNNPYKDTKRATSFTVYAFAIPQPWDEGVGFDDANDFWLTGEASLSKDGSTWSKAENAVKWAKNGAVGDLTTAIEAYEQSGDTSVVVGKQHFDHGDENLAIDITEYVNNIINSAINNDYVHYGIGLAFQTDLEGVKDIDVNYVGFFTNKTNTFYKPFVETTIEQDISDDRYSFYLDKPNKLYFVAKVGENYVNLDELPVCTIDDTSCEVVQESKGIYSVSLTLSSTVYQPQTILYDVWSNIILDGMDMGEVEQKFVTLPRQMFFTFGEDEKPKNELYPVVTGINDKQDLPMGDKRTVKVAFKVPFTHSNYKVVKDAWYRICVKDGEYEQIYNDWQKMPSLGLNNFFTIDTEDFAVGTYCVDVKLETDEIKKTFKRMLTFNVTP